MRRILLTLPEDAIETHCGSCHTCNGTGKRGEHG